MSLACRPARRATRRRPDRLHLIQQHEPGEFVYDAGYLGIRRTDDLVMINIIAGKWRDTPNKKALYRAITDNLVRARDCAPRTC